MPINFKEKGAQLSSDNFIKLKDGESIACVLKGDPHEFDIHWIGNKSTHCKGKDCDHCKTSKPSFRFFINCLVSNNGEYVAKIWDQGWMTYQKLKAIGDEYDLEKTVLKITRIGTGTDTVYEVMPKANAVLNQAQLDAIAKVKTFDLANVDTGTKPKMETASVEDLDVPF